MKKYCFWDYDGTLAYSGENLWSNTIYEAACEFGYQGGFDLLYRKVNEGKLFSWDRKDQSYENRTGRIWWEDFEARLFILLKECAMEKEGAEKACRSIRERILDPQNYHLYEDTEAILKIAVQKGYRNIVVSNNYPELKDVMEKLGIAKYFDEFVISGMVGYEKPRQEIFAIALKGKDAEACVMIGDNPAADVQGAALCGIKTVLVHKTGCTEADYCFETLREIERIL